MGAGHEAGAKIVDFYRKYGMSKAIYYNWKTKYTGLTVSELKKTSKTKIIISGKL